MKKKILLLSTTDSHLGGHAWSCLHNYYNNEKYDVRLVSLYSLYKDKNYAIIENYYIYAIIDKLIRIFYNLIYFRKINPKFSNNKYCYYRVTTFPITAKRILEKYDNGIPDAIVLYWHDGFIGPKVLRDLYDLTNARIVFQFTDEYPLGGGCHYPCECEGYKFMCEKCPALNLNKNIAHSYMKKKLELLKSIPKIVFAPTAGILQAKSSSFFKENTKFIREFRGLNMPHKYEESESRKFFGINDKEFVIMFGAMYIDEERKGVRYLIESLHMVSKQINRKIIALIPGNINQEFESIDNIDFKYIGLLSYEDLYKAFAASNVYISPSIADSGPMMVRYSIACGTPVVAFPIGYSLDYIKHKETGYLAKLQNSKELSDGILYFYNNRDRQDEFRKNCLKLNNEALSNKRAIDLLFP